MKNIMMTIKPLTAVLLAGGLISCGGDVKTNTDIAIVDTTAPVSDWQLVWSDEFDGNRIDSAKWTHEINCVGGGNNEKQCYTDSPDNSFVADGKLHIVALPAEDGAPLPDLDIIWNKNNLGVLRLLHALSAFDPARPVFVESESKKVGKLRVPDPLSAADQFFCLVKGGCNFRLLIGCGTPPSEDEQAAQVHATVDLFVRAYRP